MATEQAVRAAAQAIAGCWAPTRYQNWTEDARRFFEAQATAALEAAERVQR